MKLKTKYLTDLETSLVSGKLLLSSSTFRDDTSKSDTTAEVRVIGSADVAVDPAWCLRMLIAVLF